MVDHPHERCALCAEWAADNELVSVPGLKGRVCAPGFGCDLADQLARQDTELEDVIVDNPPHPSNSQVH